MNNRKSTGVAFEHRQRIQCGREGNMYTPMPHANTNEGANVERCGGQFRPTHSDTRASAPTGILQRPQRSTLAKPHTDHTNPLTFFSPHETACNEVQRTCIGCHMEPSGATPIKQRRSRHHRRKQRQPFTPAITTQPVIIIATNNNQACAHRRKQLFLNCEGYVDSLDGDT